MKLLAIESVQNKQYYKSRYQQVVDLGVDLYVLNGVGDVDFWPADRYRLAGSREADRLVELAKEWHESEHFDGVITFSEPAVIAVAVVAEALGLPGIGVEAAKASRNKYLMRQAHERGRAAHPAFRYIESLEQAKTAAAEFGYPVIIKPTLGAGSYFVFKVDDEAELAERYQQAKEGLAGMFWSHAEVGGVDLGPDGLLIESFLDGREFLIEAVAWDDEVYLGSVIDRITLEGATFDDDVHHGPTTLSEAELVAVHEVVKAGLHAQGLRRSVAHAEVRFHQGKPYLLEIAARVGGGGLDACARLTAGHDPIKAVADIGGGVAPQVRHYRPTGTHITAMCLIAEESGTITGIEVPEQVSTSEQVFLFKLTARPGDVNLRPPYGNSIFGFLGTTGTTFEDAMDTMTGFADRIKVTVEPK
ncbi:ATP-grasp domain-containing protein [Kitasatospora sp. NBC_01287]|uniref:ATP-grasp domain-containing protein n=1 Tax=Kitasatospora sp. NBC_01287 TaxID=2903573 RepID=UPI002256B83C|nr:ATP-grasp domain-containing protein [Kitasatospora sp. NBC_01287]MCX4749983.1 ATP-grasp domain-containing protein [Kitasatospora sp. NBC_01287]